MCPATSVHQNSPPASVKERENGEENVTGVASHELRIPAHHRNAVQAPRRDKKGLDPDNTCVL